MQLLERIWAARERTVDLESSVAVGWQARADDSTPSRESSLGLWMGFSTV